MSLLQNSNAISTGVTGYNLESSLRFRSSASAYLSRTPTTAGNRKTWTWSAWVKRGKIDVLRVFSAATSSSNETSIYFDSNNKLGFVSFIGSENARLVTTQVFRDPSAWYHIIFAVDTTQATSSNRIKIYVNGNQITAFDTATYPSQNYDTLVNSIISHYYSSFDASYHFDGYMTEVNFVDGQALTPSDFGSYDTISGVWKPKKYAGTYGTNGFYLPMKETQQATGFNTVLWAGNGGTQSITGVGFSPDLVWLKERSSTSSHQLRDSVRGVSKALFSDLTNAESDNTNLTSLDSDGFSLGVSNGTNESGQTYVAWCWDAGSSTVSNTDGTITSSVRANPATGFSVVTYTGNGTSGSTVGHGLGITPQVVITKNRTNAGDWRYWTTIVDGSFDYLYLNKTDAKGDVGGITAPTSSIFMVGNNTDHNGSGDNYVAYCFSEVSGYSKFGSYTGNGSTSGPTVTTGFRPAFVLIKRTDVADNWHIADNTRSPDGTFNDVLRANLSNAESANNTAFNITYNDTGFTLANTNSELNASGGTYIYMAFADTRDAQFNFDASGNKNNWTANNINSNASSETTYDIMNDVATLTDEDTANFCTLNPLNKGSNVTLSNGNLTATCSSTNNDITYGTHYFPTEGKWFWETVFTSVDGTYQNDLGIITLNSPSEYEILQDGGVTNLTGSFSGFSANEVIGTAWDFDNNELKVYIDGVLDTTLTVPSLSDYWTPYIGNNNYTFSVNFGQRPFAYTPPTGYKKLNTYNLPDSTIVDGSQYFYPQTYTGDGALSRSFTGLPFTPDLIWNKDRTNAYYHRLHDSVRGIRSELYSNAVDPEADNYSVYGSLTSFDTNGYTISTGGTSANFIANTSGSALVSWLWRGSDSSAVSNTDGTITSTVSANTTSGFSIVTYTGTGVSGTVGHGLSQAPDLFIIKNRSISSNWLVETTVIDGSLDYCELNLTSAFANTGGLSLPNSTVFDAGTGGNTNGSGNNMLAYCFHSVEGFSKFTSYTGNGSTDGPFIFCGFKPAFVMIKRTDTTQNWGMYDSSRDSYNVVDLAVFANASTAEDATTNDEHDFLSNGFKIRNTGGSMNASGGTYIVMAFASNPFKNSLAQ